MLLGSNIELPKSNGTNDDQNHKGAPVSSEWFCFVFARGRWWRVVSTVFQLSLTNQLTFSLLLSHPFTDGDSISVNGTHEIKGSPASKVREEDCALGLDNIYISHNCDCNTKSVYNDLWVFFILSGQKW